jgi:potassium/sodium efflux P-type ATPase
MKTHKSQNNFENKQGLSTKEAKSLLQKFGKNILQSKAKKSILHHFLEEFTDLMVLILIFAAIISFFADEKKDSVVIFTIVLINATIGLIQKYKAEKAIEALQKMIAPTANVIRDGAEIKIPAELLVPGDLMILREGDMISADATIIEANELQTMEASLTGESTPVHKNSNQISNATHNLAERSNQIFMGTSISHGSGKAIVTGTGMRTEFGKIAKLTTETTKEKSPLQKELFHIGVFVTKVTLLISTIIFFSIMFADGQSPLKALLFAAAVAVAAVPEGLPAIVTISLALGVQRLAKNNAIVKQLSSVETLGSTTVICSDKTGTLTKNEMTVRKIILSDHIGEVSGVGYKPDGLIKMQNGDFEIVIYPEKHFSAEKKDHYKSLAEVEQDHSDVFEQLKQIHFVSVLCNNSSLKNESDSWEIFGDPTEGALLTLALKTGFNLERTQNENQKIAEIPFDSNRKSMSVIYENKEKSTLSAYTKGAPDNIIEKCTHILSGNKVVELSPKKKIELLKKTEEMAQNALRTIAIAYKPIKKKQEKYQIDEIEKELILIGIVGMIDPPRSEVAQAVAVSKKAGIRTFVITGDHGLTAKAIAKQIGIITNDNAKIITGKDLNSMTETELQNALASGEEIIFARVEPEHKLKIVSSLKELGEVIAVTGDGVNDAPALKKADIGIAMGITGTDVSKEASNMILTDDSFSTIVKAIREGRTIYENMKKFIHYIFSCNIGEVLTILIAIIIGLPAPLTTVLILAVNIGTDVFPALALGLDPTEKDLMSQKPRHPESKILNFKFNMRFIYSGIFIGIMVTLIYIFTLYQQGWNFGQTLIENSEIQIKASTVAFAALIIAQLMNSFNARSDHQSILQVGIFSNKYQLAAIVFSTLALIAFVEIPFFQSWLDTTNLNFQEWALVITACFGIIIFEEIRKTYVRRKMRTAEANS